MLNPTSLQALRFLVGGAANTALSYLVYWMLLPILPFSTAYTVSYAVAILSGYAINACFVFRTGWSWRRLAAFPLVHVINYGVGLGIVWSAVRLAGIDERWAPIVATAFGLPLNFVVTRYVVAQR